MTVTPNLSINKEAQEAKIIDLQTQVAALQTSGAGAPVLAGATLSATALAHNGKVILMDQAAGSIVTLPKATGSGSRFRFLNYVVPTSNAHIVKVVDATDTMIGTIASSNDTSTLPLVAWSATATSTDTVSYNGTTTGGLKKGDWVEVWDIAATVWAVTGLLTANGTEATPFAATVS